MLHLREKRKKPRETFLVSSLPEDSKALLNQRADHDRITQIERNLPQDGEYLSFAILEAHLSVELQVLCCQYTSFQSRVNATARMIAWEGAPFGAAMGGVLAERTTVGHTYMIMALAVGISALHGWFSPLRSARTPQLEPVSTS